MVFPISLRYMSLICPKMHYGAFDGQAPPGHTVDLTAPPDLLALFEGGKAGLEWAGKADERERRKREGKR